MKTFLLLLILLIFSADIAYAQFQKVNMPGNQTAKKISIDSTNTLWALKDDGLYYSEDEGLNWYFKYQHTNYDTNNGITSWNDMAISGNNEILILEHRSHGSNVGDYIDSLLTIISSDKGNTWKIGYCTLVDRYISHMNIIADTGQSYWITYNWKYDVTRQLCMIDYIYKSKKITGYQEILDNPINNFFVYPNGSCYMKKEQERICLSYDKGTNWNVIYNINNGHTSDLLYSKIINYLDRLIYYSPHLDLFSMDYGLSWDTLLYKGIIQLSYNQTNDLLIGGNGNIKDNFVRELLLSTDQGVNWTLIKSFDPYALNFKLYNISKSKYFFLTMIDSVDYWFYRYDPTISSIEPDFQFNDEIQVFPNPSNKDINITIPQNLIVFSINIYSEIGYELENISFTDHQSQNIVLNTERYNTGIYFIKLFTNNGIVDKKVILLK